MRICWDNLEGVKLSKHGNFIKYSKIGKRSYTYYLKICEECGEEYLFTSGSKNKYCSISCSITGTNHPMYGKTHSEESKERMSKGHKRIPLSDIHKKRLSEARLGKSTAKKGRIYPHLQGKNSPKWDFSKTDEERLIDRSYREYKDWRKAVYTRDNYTCICCNKIGGKLNAHHKESYHSNKGLRTELENGATLCVDCHTKFHKEFGKIKNTKKQLYYWLLENKEVK